MINLIKNEFYKIFHKKSTYVLMSIIAILILATNIITNYYDNLNYNYSSGSLHIDELKNELNNLNPEDVNYLIEKISLSTTIKISEYEDDFEYNSWQTNYLYYVMYPLVNEYYNELYMMENEEKANLILNEMNEYYNLLINNNYTVILNLKLEEEKDLLTSLEEDYSLNKTENLETNIKIQEEKIEVLEKFIETDTEPNYDNYLYESYENLSYIIEEYYNFDIDSLENDPKGENQSRYESIHASYLTNKYMLDNQINLNEQNLQYTLKHFIRDNAMFIAVFIIMISANILSNEYSKGTIKTLLLAPHSRIKIVSSKIITSILMIPLILIFMLIIQFIIGGILYGFDSLNNPVIMYVTETSSLSETNIFIYFLQDILLYLPLFIMLTMITFTITSIFPSASFAIVISLLTYITFPLINAFITYYNVEWLRYFISIPWEYFTTYFRTGNYPLDGVTTTFAIIMSVIYFVALTVTSIIFFKKKDVKNI